MSPRTPVSSRAVWRARDMADPTQWTYRFSEDERAAIAEAARRAVDAGRTPATVDASDFEIPPLRRRLADWVKAIAYGRGFVLVRGFPVDMLSPEAVEVAYMGLGMQLGVPVGQDAEGTLLGHVRDEGIPRADPSVRLYRTRHRQDFHTDGADMVGLLCLQNARTGGESRIASSPAVYNEILERRPDLMEVLYAPMPWDRNGEESEGEDPYFSLPVVNDVGGTPRIFFIGWYIRDSQRHPGAPRLTPAQIEALDLIESIANDRDFYVEMSFEPGDVQLISNARILHSREAFDDSAEPDRRRHLLRLWLAAREFESVEDLLRGGIPARSGPPPPGARRS